MVKQNILIKKATALETASTYFTVVALANGISLSPCEVDMLAFSAINGSLSAPAIMDKYVAYTGNTKGTVRNYLTSLRKKKFMVKEDGKVRVNPLFRLNFNDDVVLTIGIKKIKDVPAN